MLREVTCEYRVKKRWEKNTADGVGFMELLQNRYFRGNFTETGRYAGQQRTG